jgi:hypothetical protein
VKTILTKEQQEAHDELKAKSLAFLEALPPEQQRWQQRLERLGACDAALKFARKYPDTIDGARTAWAECKVVETDPKTGTKMDLAAKWMAWLCMRTIDQYGVTDADTFRAVNSAEAVLAGLVARVPGVIGPVDL